MKKTSFILFLVLSPLISAQNPDSSTLFEKEYYDLMNYIPKNFKPDTENRPRSKLLSSELNTIGSLKVHYDMKEQFELDASDKLWLENRIDQIAIALFLDGKRILIKKVGGYSGCPERMIESENRNGTEVTILNFCYPDHNNIKSGEKFMSIFNLRMEKLMRNKSKPE